MTGVISGDTCNFWQKCWGTSKIKWRLNHLFECFQQWRIQSCFSTIWTVQTPIKRSSKKIFMYISWKSEIKSLWERKIFFPKCIKYLIFWKLSLQKELQVLVSQKHPFTNFKKWYSQKTSGCCILNCLAWTSPGASLHPLNPRCKGNLLRCPIASFLDCPWRQK